MADDRVTLPNERRAHARTDAGMTLVEMMIALMIIVGATTALLLIVTSGLKNQALTERVDRSTASTQAVIAKAREADFGDLGYYAGDASAPSGVLVLPVSAVTPAGATGAALNENAVVLGTALAPLRPAGTAVFTPAVATSTLNGVDSKVTTWVTWVPNSDGSTSTSKRVTVVSKWGVHPNDLTAACGSSGVRCTTQSLVRTATASDQDPVSGHSPVDPCVAGAKIICEAYIRSGRVLDGSTMASATDTPEQVSDVDLYARTASSATSVKAAWTWKNAAGATYKTVTETLAGSAEGTVWKYVVPADAAGAATHYKGDIRPGSVTVTFTADMAGTAVAVDRGAFWSYSVADDDANVTASIAQATTWCSVAGSGAPVKLAVTGHSYGFSATTKNPSSADTVDAIFTTTVGGVTKTVTVPASVDPATVVAHDQLVNGITIAGPVDATWSAVPPATETCADRAMTAVVHRAADQTTTPIALRLPPTSLVYPTLTAPVASLSLTQASGAYTAAWSTPAGATGFIVETTLNGVAATAAGPATTLTGTLTPGQSLSVRVQATTAGSSSPWSTVVSVTRTPAAPVVSVLRVANTVTFTWPAIPGAVSYDFYTIVPPGAATTVVNQTAKSVSLTVDRGLTGTIYVRAVNAGGASAWAGAASSTPLWETPSFLNGWTNYGTWETARYTRTSQHVVVLEGLIHGGTIQVPVMVLPTGYRPSHELIFEQATGNYGMVRMDIATDGAVYLYNPANPASAQDWTSLSGTTFLAADAPFTKQAPALTNGWTNFGGGFAPLTTTLDGLGRVHMQGLVNSGTLGDGTAIASFPAAYGSDQYLHISTTGMDKFGLMGISAALNSVVAKSTTAAGWQSLQGMYYSAAQAGAWSNLTLQNGWVRYNGFAAPQYTKAADGIVSLRGLITGGTVNGATIATLPPGDRPSATLIFDVANSGHLARVDVGPTGSVVLLDGGDNTWLALESINFVAEQ